MLEFDINVQRQLIEAALDDFCANAALPNVCGGQFGYAPERWRAAVIKFLGSSLAAGLIMVIPANARYRSKDATEVLRLLKEGVGQGAI